uniref:Anaphase-promoting complex subunit 4 WD40 domain-containing protein n=1 Tax=Phytophthora ramorum TaxID=164328 RepID=H3HC99_PHYRM
MGIFMIEEIQDTVPLLAFLGGDLILFNSRAKVSGIQRSMTRSEWDHVAIVVPSRDNSNLQLLEATGDGVTLTPLTARLLAYSTFHVRYFVLRKLHTPLLSRAVVNDLLERFASEVAEAYQGLGIISSSSEANDFWPGSFSPGDFADAELARHGASLSPEIIIDFLSSSKMKKLFKLASKFHGVGPVVFAWHPNGTFLATAGKNGLVHIFDRQGEQHDEIGLDLTAPVVALEWDTEGSTLAILQQGSSVVPLWDNGTRSTLSLDTNLKDPTFARWSREGSLLAVGTQKGNLVLYSKVTRKLVPVVGKHSRRILCGSWNGDDKLVLGGEDRMLTVSNPQGDTIEQRELSHTPWDIKFGRKRGDSMKAAEQLIAIALSKAIILFNLQDPSNPVELTFQTHYGNIIFIEWFADGMIMIAFSEGYLIVISTKIDEVGEELQSHRFFSERIFTACYSQTLDRVALSGESGIKVVDMTSFTEVAADSIKLSDTEENEAHLMNFTADGQILTVATQGGTVLNFLARMPRIHDHYGHYVAYLSSLRELSVVDTRRNETGSSSNGAIRIALSVEPSFVAIGPRHVAVGMNNRVWFYRCDGSSADALVNEQQYLGRVTSMKLNRDYAASLHLIEPGGGSPSGSHSPSNGGELQGEHGKVFSGGGRDERNSEISAVTLTKDFFIYSTTNGTGSLQFFYLNAWQFLDGCAYRHEDGVGIVQLMPNKSGTRVFFLDAKRRGFVLNAATRETMSVPNLPTSTTGVLWDMVDQQVFLALQPKEMGVFQVSDATIRGPEVTQLGVLEVLPDGDVLIAPQTTPIPPDLEPILVSDGIVTCQHASGGGRLASLTVVTHDQLRKVPPTSTGAGEPEKAAFRQNLSLLRLDEAWRLASRIDQRDYWLALAGRAMHTLDIPAARRAYRSLGDSGMVLGLDRLADIEEKSLLAGHVCMLFGDYSEARRLFLNSSDPLAALHMQRHLLQWEQALKLADSLARELVPELSAAYATQLEFRGEFDAALRMYEHAANAIESISRDESVAKPPEPEVAAKLKTQSLAGVARCTFRLGDLRRGVKLVTELGDSAVFKECAAILESLKQTAEAAALYEQGGQIEKAAQLFVQMKNLARAAPLMARVKASKIHAQFARAKEAAGEFAAAAEAYERAGEMDNVVRLQLEHLDGADRAFEIVRETKSSEGALSAARYCAEDGRYPNAIEFLLLANKEDEAFALAQQHGEVDSFASTLGQENMSVARASQVAEHYERISPERAAEFYQAAGGGGGAGGSGSAADSALVRAIEVVGAARNDMLTHTLIDHLMGEQDGIPKDPHHIFRLYLALGNYTQAAKTAVIIARQEQELGNYKLARDVLVETSRQLRARRLRVARDLQNALALLHSYVLVKKLVRRSQHGPAARMLVRVAQHLSKFPTHAANILISAVIECQRAGLRAYSYDFAATLMRTPEYRGSMDKDIRRKIEAIVRRPNKEQPPDTRTPCPYCSHELAEADLDCPTCKNAIPYCIVTGYHMVKDDWTQCPRCTFPGLHSQFVEHLATDATCPMCEQPVTPDDLHKVPENEVLLDDEVAPDAAETGASP